MTERNRWAITTPGMEAFDDWQPIETAPRDGSYFLGAHELTGNVYPTHYFPRWWSKAEIEERDISKAFVWWTLETDGTERSFAPTHWRPQP